VDDELIAACESAWRRLERVSGLDRSRWVRRGGAIHPDAHALLLSMPAVRAAHDEVLEAVAALERERGAADERSRWDAG
jgi:hypothetical protein